MSCALVISCLTRLNLFPRLSCYRSQLCQRLPNSPIRYPQSSRVRQPSHPPEVLPSPFRQRQFLQAPRRFKHQPAQLRSPKTHPPCKANRFWRALPQPVLRAHLRQHHDRHAGLRQWAAPPAGLARKLADLTQGSVAAGLNIQGWLVNPDAGITLILLPAAVPEVLPCCINNYNLAGQFILWHTYFTNRFHLAGYWRSSVAPDDGF